MPTLNIGTRRLSNGAIPTRYRQWMGFVHACLRCTTTEHARRLAQYAANPAPDTPATTASALRDFALRTATGTATTTTATQPRPRKTDFQALSPAVHAHTVRLLADLTRQHFQHPGYAHAIESATIEPYHQRIKGTVYQSAHIRIQALDNSPGALAAIQRLLPHLPPGKLHPALDPTHAQPPFDFL